MTELEKVADILRDARITKKVAEETIKQLTPHYFKLLDEMVGKGAVTFDYDGYKYGRVIAEKATFDVLKFRAEHPEIALDVTKVEEKVTLDEDKLNEYLAAHPEDQALVAQYVNTTEEVRWKNPVLVKDDDG